MQINDRSKNQRSIGAIAAVCFVLQIALSPYIAVFNGHANFALIFALCIALTIGGKTSVISGFVAGLVFDLATTGPVGLMTFLLTVMSFVIGNEGRDHLSEGPGEAMLPAIVSIASVSLAYNVTMLLVGQSDSALDAIIFRALPTAVLTFVCFIPFAFVLGRNRKATGMNIGSRKGSRLNVPGK